MIEGKTVITAFLFHIIIIIIITLINAIVAAVVAVIVIIIINVLFKIFDTVIWFEYDMDLPWNKRYSFVSQWNDDTSKTTSNSILKTF